MAYTDFDNILARATDSLAEPAESQGHLIGLFSAVGEPALEQWLDATMEQAGAGNALANEARDELQEEAAKMLRALTQGEMDFELMVPDDQEPIEDRVSALSKWCQGFLFGLAEGGVKSFENLPGDCAEILSDFSEVTRASAPDESEDSERAYFELFEYVRVGMQLVFEELATVSKTDATTTH